MCIKLWSCALWLYFLSRENLDSCCESILMDFGTRSLSYNHGILKSSKLYESLEYWNHLTLSQFYHTIKHVLTYSLLLCLKLLTWLCILSVTRVCFLVLLNVCAYTEMPTLISRILWEINLHIFTWSPALRNPAFYRNLLHYSIVSNRQHTTVM